MKKLVYLFLAVVISTTIISCKEKKAENFADLKAKYENKKFKNCDEFLNAFDEVLDVMVALAKKVETGDQAAIKELTELGEWMETLSGEGEKFEKECPEKVEEFQKKSEEKLEIVSAAFMKIFFGDMDLNMDEDFDAEMDSTEDVAGEIVK